MAIPISDYPETATPSEADARLARELTLRLAPLSTTENAELRVQTDNGCVVTLDVPPLAVRLLMKILREMSKGNGVAVIPVRAELSTQQAADILNVSRPFLVRLIDEGKVPARKVGTHRRIRFDDLMRYKERIDRDRVKALEELSAQAQELDMGY